MGISIQICQALVFMHSARPPVAHLDLKPENILVRYFHLDCCVHETVVISRWKNTHFMFSWPILDCRISSLTLMVLERPQ